MKKTKYLGMLMVLFTLVISCNTSDELTLQEYYVNSEKNSNYIMLDIPTSIVSLGDDATAEAKQAYESIDKVNLLAYKLANDNYLAEKEKVNKILKSSKYTELMRFNDKGNKIVAKYLGNENSMNEVIIFASDKTRGFALARVLGDDMKPENMMQLLESLKNMDEDSEVFKTMKNFFGRTGI